MIGREAIESFISGNKIPYVHNFKEFVEGETSVYYSGPYWDEKEIAAVIDTLLNGSWISAGAKVHKFEKEFGKLFGSKFSHMVNSGSSANLVLIAALKHYNEWEDGDEIIVSPVGFPTTISTIYQNRLTPVFADIEWDTLNFDLFEVIGKITPKTKAIFVSPVLGNPPDMDLLKDIAETHNLILIGDNCDTLGSEWGDEYLTKFYQAYSNSFYPAHHVSCGEGGLVATDIQEIKDLAMSYSNWGRGCYCVGKANLLPKGTCGNRFDNWLDTYGGVMDHKYVFTTMGWNLKPLDLQGSVGLEQLKKFPEIKNKRNAAKQRITEIFTEKVNVRSSSVLPKAKPCWFGTPFICEEEGFKHKLVAHLEKHKIQTRNYFAGNVLMHPGYQKLDNYKNYPEANKVLDKVFFVGCSPQYNEGVFNYIEKVIGLL